MSPAGEAQRTSSQTAKSSAFNATQGPARCTPRASKRRDQPVRPGNSPAPPTKKQAAPASPDRSDSSDTHSAGAHAASSPSAPYRSTAARCRRGKGPFRARAGRSGSKAGKGQGKQVPVEAKNVRASSSITSITLADFHPSSTIYCGGDAM
ncbi:hypothetical protein PHYSODRAFT_321285 [Phytophthora sojae]|uniref:Uncharacterized protein n=1 Tax=Phytophthora sojae (strain P6497) TaxID=1094619 RepID=G4YIA2_PHYSP|nr:hypothetical protein PHYSODRAFT_321285 [Phytophthora sojae]EGZ27485.1 hypothetical protein PHYSODRAFT_321285 [Phytophthora sojae]|eukprot:XP_009514760.1 hypothetical protein PHYSODRAFT_321285 [Phytophthora sojae]